MSEQNWSENLVVVRLPAEPLARDELDRIMQIAVNEKGFDIVVDFADVQMLELPSLCRLVVVSRLLRRSSLRVGFCNVNPELHTALESHHIDQFIEADLETEFGLPSSPMSMAEDNEERETDQERRRCDRFNLSKSLRTTAMVWHRPAEQEHPETVPPGCWQCTLVDISESGAQIAINIGQEPLFRKGQYVVMRLSPLSCDMSISIEGLVKGVLPTADSEHICLGLELVGLENNPEGRRWVQLLCDSEARYFQASASGHALPVGA